MVIVNKVGGQQITQETEWRGLSSDIKPILGVENGAKFIEIDTSNIYFFDKENQKWLEYTGI